MARLKARPAVFRCCVAALCTGLAFAQAPTDLSRLLRLAREAVTLLQQAARSDVSPDEARRRLVDAVQRLEALAADPTRRHQRMLQAPLN